MDLFNDSKDTMDWLRRMGRPDLADRIQTRLDHTDFFGTQKDHNMILDANKFTLDGDTYVAEISELRMRCAPVSFTLSNCPKPGMSRSFRSTGVDESGEDIAGWRYEEVDGPNNGLSWDGGSHPKSVPVLKVLIIND